MADIVSTLFGLPSLDGRELEEQSRNRDYTTGSQFGAAFINPYGDPNVANLEQKQFASQFALGGALTRGVGSLFGLQTTEQKRAKDIQDVLKSTQEEVGSQDPSVLYPAMSRKLADMGYGEEAFRVGQAGHQARLEQGKAVGDMAYKQSMMQYYHQLGLTQQATQEIKLKELHGQIAEGALTHLTKTEDPKVADQVWQAALAGLKAKGLDVSSLAELPPSERATALQAIVDSSETSATRTKAEIAAATLGMKQEQFKEKMLMEQTKNDLKAAIANLQAEMKLEGINAATQRAMAAKVDDFGNKLKILDIQMANTNNANAAKDVGSPEFNKQLKGFITDGLGVEDKKQISAAITDFNAAYTSYLNLRGADGMPLYTPASALAKAKQDIQQRTNKEEYFFGLREKSKYGSGNTKPTGKPIVIED